MNAATAREKAKQKLIPKPLLNIINKTAELGQFTCHYPLYMVEPAHIEALKVLGYYVLVEDKFVKIGW